MWQKLLEPTHVIHCTHIETQESYLTMSKTSAISVRIDPDIKERAELIFQQLGLTASQAITLFYRQVELRRGLPFAVELPNETTIAALEEADQKDQLKVFDNTKDLYDDLGI